MSVGRNVISGFFLGKLGQKNQATGITNSSSSLSSCTSAYHNKLTKLRRHASWVHFAKIHFGKINFGENSKVWRTNGPTYGLTWFGARDTCVPKNFKFGMLTTTMHLLIFLENARKTYFCDFWSSNIPPGAWHDMLFTRCMTAEELVNMKRLQLDLLTGMVKSPGKVRRFCLRVKNEHFVSVKLETVLGWWRTSEEEKKFSCRSWTSFAIVRPSACTTGRFH